MAPKTKKKALMNAVQNATANSKALSMAVDQAAAAAVMEKVNSRQMATTAAKSVAALDSLYKKAKDNQSRIHVASVDMGGSIAGILSFEGLNWVMRRIGDWSPKFAENIDYYQSLPHLVIGLVVYWAELLTRKPDANGSKIFPSMPREIAHEWSKVFTLLGASNLWRALRVRSKDAKKRITEIDAIKAENEALKAKLVKYEAGQ